MIHTMIGLLMISTLIMVVNGRTYERDDRIDRLFTSSSFNKKKDGYSSSAGLSLVQLSRSQIVPVEDRAEESTTRDTGKSQVVPADSGTAQENVNSNNSNTSETENSTTVASLDTTMKEAAEARRKLQRRIKMHTTGAGSVACVFCLVLWSLTKSGVLDPGAFGNYAYYSSASVLCLLCMMLGVMPSDVVTIRAAAFILGILLGLATIFNGNVAYQSWFTDRELEHDFDSDEVLPACAAELPETGCALWAGVNLVWSIITLISSLMMFSTVRKIKGATVWDSSRQKGFRFRDSAFKLPARQALDRDWFIARLFCGATGVAAIAYTLAAYAAGDDAPYFTDEKFKAHLINGIVFIICSILPSKTRRGYFMAILTAMSAETDAMSAASVAALLGNCDPSKSLELAKQKFCAINFSKLTVEHFKSNRESVGKENDLYNETEPLALGCCDAFLSHSWSEDGEEKYTALETWAKEFREKTGRWPNIWLDKACINQKQIESDLLCLPVFLAGCQTLIIIAGPTYTTRVWCVLEVFVFLTMGGSIQRIKLLPIKVETEQEAKDMFQSADIAKAECYLEADKQRILGVVEQGFGNFETFNQVIRHVFHERMEVTSITSSKGSWKSLPKSMNSQKISFSSKRISERTPSSRETEVQPQEETSIRQTDLQDQAATSPRETNPNLKEIPSTNQQVTNTDTQSQARQSLARKNNNPQDKYKVGSSTVVPLQ